MLLDHFVKRVVVCIITLAVMVRLTNKLLKVEN